MSAGQLNLKLTPDNAQLGQTALSRHVTALQWTEILAVLSFEPSTLVLMIQALQLAREALRYSSPMSPYDEAKARHANAQRAVNESLAAAGAV